LTDTLVQNASISRQEALLFALQNPGPDGGTRLTLKVGAQLRKRRELLSTSRAKAVIYFQPVDWGIEMLAQ
jgi:hypothetical protein